MRRCVLFAIVVIMSTVVVETAAQTLPTPAAVTDPKKISSKPNAQVEPRSMTIEKLYMTRQVGRPTWSPDGNWIAFLHHGAYYAIRPNGQERKKLFHRSGTESPLYWSPDSRIVAFVSPEGFFEGGWRAIDADNYKLRVRRLDDNSEDWIAYVDGARSYQWVTNPQLVKQVESGTTTRQPPEESRRKVLTDKSSRGGLPHVRAVDVLAGIHQR